MSSTTTTRRQTVAGAYAQIEALRNEVNGNFARLFEALNVGQPAEKATKASKKASKATGTKAAPKATTKKAKGTKGSQTRETLSRTEFNRTVTAKARLAGKVNGTSVYRTVLNSWAQVQELREQGHTPDQVLEALTQGKASKKGKKAKVTAPVVAEVRRSQKAKVTTTTVAASKPRNAQGQITPKEEWSLRESLAETGKYDREEIDAKVAEARALGLIGA